MGEVQGGVMALFGPFDSDYYDVPVMYPEFYPGDGVAAGGSAYPVVDRVRGPWDFTPWRRVAELDGTEVAEVEECAPPVIGVSVSSLMTVYGLTRAEAEEVLRLARERRLR